MADRRNIAMRPSLATPGRSRAAFAPPQNFSEIRSSGAVAGIQRELEKARQSGDEAKEQSLLAMLEDSDPAAQDELVPTGLRKARERLNPESPNFVATPLRALRDGLDPSEAFEDNPSYVPLPLRELRAGRDPSEAFGDAKLEPETKPKAQLERFEAVGEMDFDKVARPPGDPFVYAMKDGKIFVMDPKNPKAGFRDVTGIQNEAAIRSVIEKFGKPPASGDVPKAGAAAKRSGGGTMDMRELTGVEDRPPLEEERILGTKR